jgi:hypothetical protein
MVKIKKSIAYEGFEAYFKIAGKPLRLSNIPVGGSGWPYGKRAILKIINKLEKQGIDYKIFADVVSIENEKCQINNVHTKIVSKGLIEKLSGKHDKYSGRILYYLPKN